MNFKQRVGLLSIRCFAILHIGLHGTEARAFSPPHDMFTLFFIYILKKLLKKSANCGNIIIDFIYRFNILRFS